MNPYLEQRLQAILKQLRGAHEGGDAMSMATRGSEREVFVDLLLRGSVPMPYRFGSGEVTDVYGNRSGQLDLVIEYPFFPSLPLLGTSQHRLYLVEGVAIVIEVKSSFKQFDDVVRTLKQFRSVIAHGEWPKTEDGHEPNLQRLAVIGTGVATSFPARTAFAAVFYDGCTKPETLRKRCDDADLDVALQLDPCMFYSRHYRDPGYDDPTTAPPKSVEGVGALMAFLCVVAEELRATADVHSHIFRRYVEQEPPPH